MKHTLRERVFISPTQTTYPVCPIISLQSPTLVATQGTSEDMASPSTFGNASPTDDDTNTSNEAIMFGTSSL